MLNESSEDDSVILEEEYGQYFLYQEGKLFYWYVMACAILALTLTVLICCFAGCLFMFGGFVASK